MTIRSSSQLPLEADIKQKQTVKITHMKIYYTNTSLIRL